MTPKQLNDEPMQTLGVRLPITTLALLQRLAAKDGRTPSQLARMLLERALLKSR
jgi:hypothetical protein